MNSEDEGWQPIETVPRDGTEVILRDRRGRTFAARWSEPEGRWSTLWIWRMRDEGLTGWRAMPGPSPHRTSS